MISFCQLFFFSLALPISHSVGVDFRPSEFSRPGGRRLNEPISKKIYKKRNKKDPQMVYRHASLDDRSV
jgi:hypothetical protein